MGRKKPVRENESLESSKQGGGGGGKSKKKNRVIDDDDYSVGTELSEDTVVLEDKAELVPEISKKRGKKGKKSGARDEDVEETEDKLVRKEEDDEKKKLGGGEKNLAKQVGGGGKSKKKNVAIDDDEYSIGTEISAETQEEELAPAVAFGKKKSKKGKKGGVSTSDYGSLGQDDDDEDVSGLSRDRDGVVGDSDREAESVASVTGKTKNLRLGKSSASLSVTSVFHAIDDQDNETGQLSEEDEESTVAFTGRSSGISFSAALLDEENDADTSLKLETEAIEEDDAPGIIFSGRKKSSKKKNKSASSTIDTAFRNDSTNVADQDHCSLGVNREDADDNRGKKQTTDVLETSKNKTKKKKSGHASKILAGLGEGSTITTPAQPAHASLPQEEKSQQQSQLGDDTGERRAVEEAVKSAAAKKKKKKEKEKEKKAAAAAAAVSEMEEKQEGTKNDTRAKLADKKQSKQVREMQERLKKMKEAEESKKKEEEERLRKEEEEHLRLEELERLAEEKKHLKKEREKEKLLKKKLEGKLLTGKQKEEARRLEAMRKQFLASGGALPLYTGESRKDATKRPIYQSKKSKAQAWANGKVQEESVESTEVQENQQEIVSEVDSMETEKAEHIDLVSVEEKSEVPDAEENRVEEEEDEEWDARSWDDADLKLPRKSAFEDEELDSDPQPIITKAARSVVSDTGPLPVAAKSVIPTQKAVASVPDVTKNDGSKKREPVVVVSGQGTEKPGASSSKSEDNLRSPICCIMGHVDTGKTKLLDCIRGTNVQEGEAGGITQQIGATYFPAENIRERTKELKADAKLKVPGLLVIDTPGHESFTNLRSRGSGLCDIAILVVDIMHGLEPQTIESLNLLKMRNTEFIVALNKIDRLYGWKVCRNAPIVKAMKQQSKDVQFEFNTRLTQIVTQFKEQGINTELYYRNKEMGKDTFSIIPTSAISGEGIPDLLLLLVQWTQKTMVERLTYSSEVQCTVLEVKAIEGHGTTIDVVLINGMLHEGDQIIVCGMQDPIVTSIRALLTPHPMKELRIKGSYVHHKEIKAAQGIKINAQGLEHAIAGTSLYVVGPDDDVENIKEAAMEDMRSVMSRIDRSGEGVYVQASTLGSLEALLEFLKTDEVRIPVSGIGIGTVHKKDVMKASVMLEKKKEYATILAFDVKVTQEARELADEAGVKIFIADIIYHLFDQFKAYIDNLKEEKKKEVAEEAVFPCSLKIVPNHVYNKKDPIVVGVDVLEGIARVGTPICIPHREFIDIGRIASIENNHRPVDSAKKGQRVSIKIVGSNSEEKQKMFGRHFEIEDELVSKVSRRSIDILKANFRNDLSIEDWKLVKTLRDLFKIQ
ncbi:eukaryotic translation initiation factor 5B-like [Solanum stenotomum]|uniref:eukaryotic translation initiation factor 5B-like n=1 Tax=Solanum stenotomum TaxID=172797 RepID=UPI0020D14B14|nr:eukaryotic translation initiation factor 5B-like [Solanum stenotomum]